MQTVIFLTSTTSATGSMWRTISALADRRWTQIAQAHLAKREGVPMHSWVPPEEDHVILFNGPMQLNRDLDLGKYKLVVNLRDPRDLACNKYHWQFSHPYPGDTPEIVAARHAKLQAEGIDRFVLDTSYVAQYDRVAQILESAPRENWTFVGYALYCLLFDDAVAKIASMLDTDVWKLNSGRRKAVEAERTENLAGNRRWIGQRWQGSDTAPGRHKHELKPETIVALNAMYARSLRFLRSIEDPRLVHLLD